MLLTDDHSYKNHISSELPQRQMRAPQPQARRESKLHKTDISPSVILKIASDCQKNAIKVFSGKISKETKFPDTEIRNFLHKEYDKLQNKIDRATWKSSERNDFTRDWRAIWAQSLERFLVVDHAICALDKTVGGWRAKKAADERSSTLDSREFSIYEPPKLCWSTSKLQQVQRPKWLSFNKFIKLFVINYFMQLARLRTKVQYWFIIEFIRKRFRELLVQLIINDNFEVCDHVRNYAMHFARNSCRFIIFIFNWKIIKILNIQT